MKNFINIFKSGLQSHQFNSIYLLVVGTVLLFGTHMNYGVDILAWIAYVPFLLYLGRTSGWKSRVYFGLFYVLAWHLVVAKIITAPLSMAIVPLFALPIAVMHLPAFLIWARFKDRKFSWVLFSGMMVIMEWVQYQFTPMASWGASAYTQHHNILLIQSVSLFGLAGLSFLVYLVNVVIYDWFQGNTSKIKLLMTSGIIGGLLVFGGIRYGFYKNQLHEQIVVAAIGTESKIGTIETPTWEENELDIRDHFIQSKTAADAGAELLVWNEAAFYLLPENETEWVDSFSRLAKAIDAHIVASYVTVLSDKPLKYANKFWFISNHGELLYSYHKHEPVPGEPAIRGQEVYASNNIGESVVGGAICYDYDFPYIAKAYGKLKTDIVALPSSDWRGIDPLHTKMAAYRAIEQGHSILRSTRFGLSAAINPLGEFTAQLSSFDNTERMMIGLLPKDGAFSLYRVVGDLFVYVLMLAVVAVLTRYGLYNNVVAYK